MAHRLTAGHAPRLGKHREGRNNSVWGLAAGSGAREGFPDQVALEQALSECVGEEKSATANRMQQKPNKKEGREHHIPQRGTNPAYL